MEQLEKVVAVILDSESGTSLRAAGWKCVGQAGGASSGGSMTSLGDGDYNALRTFLYQGKDGGFYLWREPGKAQAPALLQMRQALHQAVRSPGHGTHLWNAERPTDSEEVGTESEHL